MTVCNAVILMGYFEINKQYTHTQVNAMRFVERTRELESKRARAARKKGNKVEFYFYLYCYHWISSHTKKIQRLVTLTLLCVDL